MADVLGRMYWEMGGLEQQCDTFANLIRQMRITGQEFLAPRPIRNLVIWGEEI